LVALFALLSAVWLDDKDAWGALGQWAGAFGAVLAVTVALRISQREAGNAFRVAQHDADNALRISQQETERDAERRRAEKAERELEQARLVVAAIEYPSIQEEINVKNLTGLAPPDGVRITNFSTTHVFHPRIDGFVHPGGGTVTWDVESEFPGFGYEAPPPVLGTGNDDLIPVSLKYDPPITPDMYPMRTKVIIGFTDADGRRWRRFGESTPERMSADDTFDIGGPDWYRAER
jgi:hypothetical protein